MDRRPANSRPDFDPAREARVEQFIGRAAHSHFMQSRAWLAAFADERESVEHVVTHQDDGTTIGACSGVRRVRGWALEKCFVDGGPVYDCEAQLERHLDDLAEATRVCAYLRVRPYLAERDGGRLRELLADHSFRMLPPQGQSGYATTLVLDLTRSIESLHAGFSTGLKRNLRRTAREGLSVERIVDGPAIAEFAAMLGRAAGIAGYDVPPPDRVAAYLESLCQRGPASGALFCARGRGRLRAGIVVLRAASSLVYQWGARSDPSAQGDAPLAHALHWEAIKWGRDQAFERYDFGGLSEGPTPTGIDRFKQAFGGERQRMFGEAIRTRGLWGRVVSSARLVRRLRAVTARNRTRAAHHAEGP